MAFFTIIGGCLCIVDATDIHRIDIHVRVFDGGVLVLTARSGQARAADHARFVSAVRGILA